MAQCLPAFTRQAFLFQDPEKNPMLGRLLKNLFQRQRATTPVATQAANTQQRQIPQHVNSQINHLLDQAWQQQEQGNLNEAEQYSRSALALDPGFAYTHLVLSSTLTAIGKKEQALQHALYAQQWMPNYPACVNQLGIAHMEMGNYGQAQKFLQRAAQLNPRSPHILCNLALLCQHSGNIEGAIQIFQQSLAIDPAFELTHMNLALLYLSVNNLEAALEHACKATRLAAVHPSFRINLELILLGVRQLPKAQNLELALLDTPTNCLTNSNCNTALDAEDRLTSAGNFDSKQRLTALLLNYSGDLETAEKIIRPLVLSSGRAEDKSLLGEILLGQHKWQEGWQYYESRLETPTFPRRHSTSIPVWTTESISGKSIYLLAEQGLGDQIMFASCLPDLLLQGATITMECEPRLLPLFRCSFPQVEFLPLEGDRQPVPERGFDFIAYLGSLPSRFRPHSESFPRHHGFLKAAPEQSNIKRSSPPRIGLCWRGGLAQTGRHQRSIELQQLDALLQVPGIHALQRDESAEERSYLCSRGATPFDPALLDINALSTWIAGADLIITVCCTVAHLAGGLGVKTLVLTPTNPSWRYGIVGDTMPWYPSASLLRQQRPGDWSEVLTQATQHALMLEQSA